MIMVRLERVWIILRFPPVFRSTGNSCRRILLLYRYHGKRERFAYIGGKTIFIKTCYLVQVNQIGAVGLEKASAYKEMYTTYV